MGSVKLCGLQLQSFLEFAVEVECLTFIEIDADTVEFTFKIDAVMVLDIVGVGTVTADSDGLQKVIMFVLLVHLVIADQHLGIDAGRILSGDTRAEKGDGVLFLLLTFKIDKEAEFIKSLVLIEVIELAGYLLTISSDEGRADLSVSIEIDDYRLVRTVYFRRVAHMDREALLSEGCCGEVQQGYKE